MKRILLLIMAIFAIMATATSTLSAKTSNPNGTKQQAKLLAEAEKLDKTYWDRERIGWTDHSVIVRLNKVMDKFEKIERRNEASTYYSIRRYSAKSARKHYAYKLKALVKWRHNNQVNSTLTTDGGRDFETRFFTIAFIVMGVVLEMLLLYLAFFSESQVEKSLSVALVQVAIFVIKLMLFNLFFIIIRWTLPRFRYDQVQKLGWYYLLPLALLNLFITALVVVGVGL